MSKKNDADSGMMKVTKTELVWPGKYNDDGTLREVPRIFVVGAYFNPAKLEIHHDIFLIPSIVFATKSAKIKKYDRLQIVAPLNRNSRSTWTKYLIPVPCPPI